VPWNDNTTLYKWLGSFQKLGTVMLPVTNLFEALTLMTCLETMPSIRNCCQWQRQFLDCNVEIVLSFFKIYSCNLFYKYKISKHQKDKCHLLRMMLTVLIPQAAAIWITAWPTPLLAPFWMTASPRTQTQVFASSVEYQSSYFQTVQIYNTTWSKSGCFIKGKISRTHLLINKFMGSKLNLNLTYVVLVTNYIESNLLICCITNIWNIPSWSGKIESINC